MAMHSLSEHPPALLTRSAFNAESFRRRPAAPLRRRFSSSVGRPAPMKPPSVLVFTGDSDELFTRIDDSLRGILPSDSHVVFHISLKGLQEHPWIDNQASCLMIADTKSLDDRAWLKLQDYFKQGGKMMFVCQNSLLASLTDCETTKKRTNMLKMAFGDRQVTAALGKDFEQFLKRVCKQLKNKELNETFHAKDLVGGYRYSMVASKKPGAPLLLYMQNQSLQASALFSDATIDVLLADGCKLIGEALERLGVTTVDSPRPAAHLQYTPGYLVQSPDSPRHLNLLLDKDIGTLPKLHFSTQSIDRQPSANYLPIAVNPAHFPHFDETVYFDQLTSDRLGRAVLFVPICGSTMDIAQSLASGLPNDDAIVVVARHQTKGRGRSGNQWLSPAGCAMFSFNLRISLNSKLGRAAGFIQHLLAVSVVDGICSIPEMKGFPLKLKWPNDIYYNRSYKMGGVLVNCSVIGSDLICTLGCGLNVSNSNPTICLNDMLPDNCGSSLSVEQVIAVSLSTFEGLVKLFQQGGADAILPIYYDYWLHTSEEVLLADRQENVLIRGLDQHGYLEVRSRKTGKVFSVHPDGNTFDMMKNLIRAKVD
uniref:BPL/LPL catalytic domain-containing protein n=1 Tax=Plectus sambesii TaxID=2011161 RepID=A0A914WUU0_9BILA